MCRPNQLRGYNCLAFGLGLLIGCCIESAFWCCILGVAAMVFGFLQLQKK